MGSSWYERNLNTGLNSLARRHNELVDSFNSFVQVIADQAQDIHDLKERCRDIEAQMQQSRDWDIY